MHAPESLQRSVAVVKAFQKDTQLLTLLVEMTALETEGAGSVRNIMVMTIELKQDFGAFKSEHTLGEWTGLVWTRRVWSCGMNSSGVNAIAGRRPGWNGDLRGR